MSIEYFAAAYRELAQRPALSTIVVAMMAVGVSVPSVMISLWNLLIQDPIPTRSALLYHIQMDHWHTRQEWDKDHLQTREGEPPEQITFMDAKVLLDSVPGAGRTAFYEIDAAAQSSGSEFPRPITVGAAHSDFFSMMDVPLASGRPWSRAEDDARAQVTVISADLSGLLFQGKDPVGQQLVLSGNSYTIVGVLSQWRPTTKFFASAIYGRMNDAYIPFDTAIDLQLSPSSAVRCSLNVATALPELEKSECAWIQLWVLLKEPRDTAELLSHLTAHVMEQKRMGRFSRPLNNKILNAQEWVRYVQGATGMSSILGPATAVGFALLLATVANAIALLLAKFLRTAHHVALRRAVGASRLDIFLQYIAEALLIGIAASTLGLMIASASMYVARHKLDALLQAYGFSLESTATVQWDLAILSGALGIAAALLAGVYPAWSACRVSPAILLNGER